MIFLNKMLVDNSKLRREYRYCNSQGGEVEDKMGIAVTFVSSVTFGGLSCLYIKVNERDITVINVTVVMCILYNIVYFI